MSFTATANFANLNTVENKMKKFMATLFSQFVLGHTRGEDIFNVMNKLINVRAQI